jgi:hypothetical protein
MGTAARMLAAAIVVLVAAWVSSPALAAVKPSKPMPEATEAFLEAGRTIYFRRCSFCHGLLGDGEGPAAKYLDPRPRDFTLGTFKFRTTKSGELPTNEDLFRTVSRGLPGTVSARTTAGRSSATSRPLPRSSRIRISIR